MTNFKLIIFKLSTRLLTTRQIDRQIDRQIETDRKTDRDMNNTETYIIQYKLLTGVSYIWSRDGINKLQNHYWLFNSPINKTEMMAYSQEPELSILQTGSEPPNQTADSTPNHRSYYKVMRSKQRVIKIQCSKMIHSIINEPIGFLLF